MCFEGGRGPRDGGGYERLEGEASAEHVLDERRRRHQVLKLQVEDPLQTLHRQRA